MIAVKKGGLGVSHQRRTMVFSVYIVLSFTDFGVSNILVYGAIDIQELNIKIKEEKRTERQHTETPSQPTGYPVLWS